MLLRLRTRMSLHWVIIIALIAGVPDPTRVFWLIEMLKGYGKLGSRFDTRMPITLSILRTVLQQTSTICASEYRVCMFKAMCTTAFFAFLRVGEITCCPRSSSVLQLNQIVQLVDHSGGVIGLKITFFNAYYVNKASQGGYCIS